MSKDAGTHPHAADRPVLVRLHALALIALAAAALALPFMMLMRGARPPSIDLAWDFSVGLGFGALGLIALQFALTGRLRWLTHPFGADIVYLAHRYLSWAALGLMLGHFGIFYIWHQPALGVLNPLQAPWELTAGRLALLCFIVLVLTSQFRKWLHLPFEHWRVIHLSLAIIGFAAAIAHVLGVGRFTADTDKRLLWLGVTAGWLLLLAWTRLVVPWLQTRNPWRVVANRDEGGGVHTLELAPEGRGLTRWKPGQFAWLAIDRSPWSLKEHPFTISTAPDRGGNLSFSIKPLGDDTRRLIHTAPGTRAYVHGPFGAFSVDREADAPGFVMIAGGVGITPIISNLHALLERGDTRPIVLFYANSQEEDIAFRAELEDIRDSLDLTLVLVLEDPPEGWQGESGYIDDALLSRHLPADSRDWPHLLCGPAPMTEAVTKALRDLGVAPHRIDSEIFDLV
ncbi:MAG: ferredoxin reductase family protein [Pararhodobacter sp.]|nr:ferredoxin reductase family protein [Pararhodobacter sp.]